MGADNLFGVDMAKVMFGQHAFHIPMNLIVQDCGDGVTAAGVFQTKSGAPLFAGSKKTHVLLLGDMVFRPRIILASNNLQGMGISHIFTDGFVTDVWDGADRILVPDLPKETKGGKAKT